MWVHRNGMDRHWPPLHRHWQMLDRQNLPDKGSVTVQTQARLIAIHRKKRLHHLATPEAKLSTHWTFQPSMILYPQHPSNRNDNFLQKKLIEKKHVKLHMKYFIYWTADVNQVSYDPRTLLLQMARMKIACILKNRASYLSLKQNQKWTMDYSSCKKFIEVLDLNLKAIFWAPVKVRKEDFFIVLARKQQKCLIRAPLINKYTKTP